MMKTFPLLPNRCKMIGCILLIAAIALAVVSNFMGSGLRALDGNVFALLGSDAHHATSWFTMVNVNLTYTITGVLFIVGAMLVAFSREIIEDEYTMHQRLQAFQWSVVANYALLLVLFLTVYGIDFLLVMSYNLYTVVVLFILRFHYLLSIEPKHLPNEK